MKKYLAGVLTLMVCSSFISFRLTDDGNGRQELRLYPIAADGATYVLREYQQLHHKVRQEADGTSYGIVDEYLVRETAIVHAERKRMTQLYVQKSDSVLEETHYYGSRVSEVRKGKGPFATTTLYLNDSLRMETTYYSNGLLNRCKVMNSRRQKWEEIMEWDPQNQTCWTGVEQNVPVYDTDIIYTENEETLRIKVTDTRQRTGLWKKYDRQGTVTDSMMYDERRSR
ncbi:hypothetical protein GCM10023093_15810 [Nemorincola caseinilytica]|uniref:YD repeat-containing protein n=1 Tax=Nemorincola caseinilytica TaxID=2054315 RepID=A0ABP8NEY8_9BACT